MSNLEELLNFQIKAMRLPTPERQFRFHPKRRWKSDFAWPDKKVICEVEGGIWCNGRHSRGMGYESDCEKYNHATLMDYKVIRVTSFHIKTGKAINWIKEALR